jgi:hypothetical protein
MSEELDQELRQIIKAHIAGGMDPAEALGVINDIRNDLQEMQEVGL